MKEIISCIKGYELVFMNGRRYGRSTAKTCPWSRGVLPNPEELS